MQKRIVIPVVVFVLTFAALPQVVDNLGGLRGQIDGFDARFAALSGQIEDPNQKIDTLDTRLNSVDQHVSHLDPSTLFGILPAT